MYALAQSYVDVVRSYEHQEHDEYYHLWWHTTRGWWHELSGVRWVRAWGAWDSQALGPVGIRVSLCGLGARGAHPDEDVGDVGRRMSRRIRVMGAMSRDAS